MKKTFWLSVKIFYMLLKYHLIKKKNNNSINWLDYSLKTIVKIHLTKLKVRECMQCN